MLHKDALVQNSTFFRAALDGQFKEAKEKTVRLLESDAQTFAIFAHWVYTNDTVFQESTEVVADEVQQRYEERTLMIQTYILGDQFGCSRLQNQVITQYIDLAFAFRVTPGIAHAKLIYDNLPEQSNRRQLMIDYYVSNVKSDWFKSNTKELPPHFITDVLVSFVRAAEQRSRPKSPRKRDQCIYHVHNKETPKCS